MFAGQPLHKLLDDWARGAIPGVPANSVSIAVETLYERIDIGVGDVDFLDIAVAFAPVALGSAATQLLDFRSKHRAPVQQHLEAIVIGRVMATGDLDPALDVQRRDREIEHR